MNILTDVLPTAVEIEGQVYELDTNFRTCLKIILAFEDNELAQFEKQAILLDNLYPVIPENTQKALENGIKFLDGGDEPEEGEGGSITRLYSFSKDAQFIFSAFKQTHGIDLEEVEYLHWWKFIYLFVDLGSGTTFTNLVSLRKRLADGKATKEERAAAREMGDLLEVPQVDNRTLEEKESEERFMNLLGSAK